jgi:hypothetical protein
MNYIIFLLARVLPPCKVSVMVIAHLPWLVNVVAHPVGAAKIKYAWPIVYFVVLICTYIVKRG